MFTDTPDRYLITMSLHNLAFLFVLIARHDKYFPVPFSERFIQYGAFESRDTQKLDRS